MKKTILCFLIGLGMIMPHTHVKAGDNIGNSAATVSTQEQQITALYNSITFDGCSKLSLSVFINAYKGYLNLRQAGKLSTDKEVLTVCDMSLSANENRMWIIDLSEKKVLLNTYVAHGQGSGDEFANKFSNTMNSHQSSLGFYVTGETYNGEHGNSLYLHGMDKGYNNLAYERNIVVHGADYVNPRYIASNQRLGRSWGCPAVSSKLSEKVIGMIKEGTCLFVYYPQPQYLQASVWLNKAVQMTGEFDKLALASAKQREIVYEYSPRIQEVMNMVSRIKLPLM